MPITPQITGVLRNARRVSRLEDRRGPCLAGQVYDDKKGRFHDGERIITSRITAELDDDVFVTSFSAYKVESWVGQPAGFGTGNRTADSINAFVELTHGASTEAGWWIDPLTGSDYDKSPYFPFVVATKLALGHSELSEALEGHRKGAKDDHLPNRPSIEVELADAMIRIGDLAGKLKLDLGGAIVEKMAYNAIRADHKPGARQMAGGKAY